MRRGTTIRGTAVAVALGAAAGLAACSSAGTPSPGRTGPAPSASAPLAVPTRTRPMPNCSTVVAPARTLGAVHPAMTATPAVPFGVVSSPDGRWMFVADAGGVTVLRAGTDGAAPTVQRTVAIPGGEGVGETLTPDGRYLLVVTPNDIAVLDVAKLESGSAGSAAGALPVGGSNGAIEVATSADGRYAFTSLEDARGVRVFNLARALSAGFRASGVAIGTVPVGTAPVGEAVSPDGRWLYVTSEEHASDVPPSAKACAGDPDSVTGDLRVISVSVAEHDPAHAVRSVTLAAASPVRVALSDAGQLAWVTARGSDALLGLATNRLQSGQPAVVADVPVGSAPVGVVLVGSGRWAVVADSDRFSGGNTGQWLSVVSVPDALAGRPALAGQIPAGGFPRELALTPDGRTLYATNYTSNQLETISVPGLVRAASR